MNVEKEEEKTDIFIEGIDVELLRQQRTELLSVMDNPAYNTALLDGLVALLDAMLDVAEGFPEPIFPPGQAKIGH